jgi:hypothetical protein
MAVFVQSRPRHPARYPRLHFLSLREEKTKLGPSHFSIVERLGRGVNLRTEPLSGIHSV